MTVPIFSNYLNVVYRKNGVKNKDKSSVEKTDLNMANT
jgi:hypothetical protein